MELPPLGYDAALTRLYQAVVRGGGESAASRHAVTLGCGLELRPSNIPFGGLGLFTAIPLFLACGACSVGNLCCTWQLYRTGNSTIFLRLVSSDLGWGFLSFFPLGFRGFLVFFFYHQGATMCVHFFKSFFHCMAGITFWLVRSRAWLYVCVPFIHAWHDLCRKTLGSCERGMMKTRPFDKAEWITGMDGVVFGGPHRAWENFALGQPHQHFRVLLWA